MVDRSWAVLAVGALCSLLATKGKLVAPIGSWLHAVRGLLWRRRGSSRQQKGAHQNAGRQVVHGGRAALEPAFLAVFPDADCCNCAACAAAHQFTSTCASFRQGRESLGAVVARCEAAWFLEDLRVGG